MTKQLAIEALAQRLERVWWTSGATVSRELLEDGGLKVTVAYSGGVQFSYSPMFPRLPVFVLSRHAGADDVMTGHILCVRNQIETDGLFVQPELRDAYAEFASAWLAFFRRGCWLSGVDIEANAHEKMEWIQGYSREELESWNLKF